MPLGTRVMFSCRPSQKKKTLLSVRLFPPLGQRDGTSTCAVWLAALPRGLTHKGDKWCFQQGQVWVGAAYWLCLILCIFV